MKVRIASLAAPSPLSPPSLTHLTLFSSLLSHSHTNTRDLSKHSVDVGLQLAALNHEIVQ